MARRTVSALPSIALIAATLLSPALARSDEALSVHVNVTTENGAWAPQFERCIQRGIAAKAGNVSAVAFTPYTKSAVDIFVVTQPARTKSGEQWGIVAAVVADIRNSGLPPEVLAVTAEANRTGMAFICRAAVDLFYGKITAELRQSQSLSDPQPFDAWEAEFEGLE